MLVIVGVVVNKTRMSVYLDELNDDPLAAIKSAKEIGLTHICLRRVWATNVCRASDNVCKTLHGALSDSGLSVLMVCSDDGNIAADELAFDDQVRRSLLVASYFRALMFRVGAGLRGKKVANSSTQSRVDSWLTAVGTECLRSAIVPVIETGPDDLAFEPADVAALLERHNVWRLLYDPAVLISRRRQDPHLRYWSLLRPRVAAIDLHDIKTGVGFVPAGTGDAMLGDTIRDCVAVGYTGWFIAEPGVSRRSSQDRALVVRSVIANYEQMVVAGRQNVASWGDGGNKRGGRSAVKKPR